MFYKIRNKLPYLYYYILYYDKEGSKNRCPLWLVLILFFPKFFSSWISCHAIVPFFLCLEGSCYYFCFQLDNFYFRLFVFAWLSSFHVIVMLTVSNKAIPTLLASVSAIAFLRISDGFVFCFWQNVFLPFVRAVFSFSMDRMFVGNHPNDFKKTSGCFKSIKIIIKKKKTNWRMKLALATYEWELYNKIIN